VSPRPIGDRWIAESVLVGLSVPSASKPATPTDWIDPDDAPELTDEFFERADEYAGDTLIRRGRPPSSSPKQAVTVRYDADVIAAFKMTGRGWQTRMTDALRDWLRTHPLPEDPTHDRQGGVHDKR
jgi:uncharacterized protein (DUF4415 family)